jgi:DNA-directed RNA polymerase subunit RPC12/RpoP
MSDDEIALSMEIPVDSDGFLRRECPTCEREFKWLSLPSGEEAASDMTDAGYFCPYCGVQAPADAWFTKAQLELAEHIVQAAVVNPMLRKFAGGTSGQSEEPEPLNEDDDMRRIDFACHSSEPLKILDGWQQPVHCLVCGQASAQLPPPLDGRCSTKTSTPCLRWCASSATPF